MSYTKILVIISIWISSFQIFSQVSLVDKKVSVDFNGVSIEKALELLTKESGVAINYSPSELPKSGKISKAFKQTPLKKIITIIWGDDDLLIKVIDDLIFLKKKSQILKKGNLLISAIDENNIPIAGVNVQFKNTSKGKATNLNGVVYFNDISVGEHILVLSYIGYKTTQLQVVIRSNKTINISHQLQLEAESLNEIIISSETAAEKQAKRPIQITAIDAKEIRDLPLIAQDLVRKSTGVFVRQSAGFGSQTSINLNGLTGKAVPIYYDGLPIVEEDEYLKILPVGLIDRVDIYKGVMPVEIGTDALGGGINIIPRKIKGNYLESSYQIGSFNTHLFSLIGQKKITPRFTAGTQVTYNYSDNDYRMKNIPVESLEVIDNIFGRKDTIVVESIENVKRFHNRHRSYYIEGNAEWYDRKWTDRLTLSMRYLSVFNEIQNGVSIDRRPYGEVEHFASIINSTIRYKKKINDRWHISQISNLSHIRNFINDSTKNRYNWRGEILPIIEEDGSEIGETPTKRRGKNIDTSHRTIVKYELNSKHTMSISNFFEYLEISGDDPLGNLFQISINSISFKSIKSRIKKNILGFQHVGKWLTSEQFTTTSFYKNYYSSVATVDFDINTTINDFLRRQTNKISHHGIGTSFKYKFSEYFFARSSYEYATRLPDGSELFGNFANILPNVQIKPERSNNLNIGLHAKYSNEDFKYDLDLNFFLRNQRDLIRIESLDANFGRFINEDRVNSKGFELSLNAKPISKLFLEFNFTYQDIVSADTNKIAEKSFIGARIPNIPHLFINTSISYDFLDLFAKDDQLKLYWNYFYVDPFAITDKFTSTQENSDNFVPMQQDHNFGFSYRHIKSALTLSCQLNNAFDNELFDNFKAPKPGRNVMLKLSYQPFNK